jgi:hypothetical protein
MTVPPIEARPPAGASTARLRALLALLTLAVIAIIDVGAGNLRTRMRNNAAAEAERLESRYRTPNPRYHHDLKPNMSTDSAMWGPIRYPVTTNSLGFKDSRVRDVPLVDSLYRILFIGDSFTEGDGIPFDSTFVGVIQDRIRDRGGEALNAGVVSYSPIIYWKKVEDLLVRRGLQVNAVAVFLDISDIQDEALVYQLDANGNVADKPLAKGWWWARNSMFFRGVRRAALTLSPRDPFFGCGGTEFGDLTCRAAWTTSPAIMRAWGTDGLAIADTHMTRLAALLRARHVPLTIVVYPWPQQLTANDRSSIQVRYWQAWAQREGARFIELFDPFFAKVDAHGLPAVIDQYFISGDVHWNARGHAFVASEFLAHFPVDSIRPVKR